jgi:hypothetical protein
MKALRHTIVGCAALLAFCSVAAPRLEAVEIKVLVDTPWSFRATFTGVDTDPFSLDAGAGNDFIMATFNYWTVVLNLRGDGVEAGLAKGFYEIKVIHNGTKDLSPGAPDFGTFLFYEDLVAGVVLTDAQSASAPHGTGTDDVSTSINITFDDDAGLTHFDGLIAADADDDGDGKSDSLKPTEEIVNDLQGLKDDGQITGQEMGQIIKQTNKPVAPGKK